MKYVILVATALAGSLAAQSLAPLNEDGVALGALAPAAINKTRPKPGFDITGTWLHGGGANNPFQFAPPAGFKLTPDSQKHYDAAKKAQQEGKAYHDDIGQCWPAGLPVIMTRVWPIAMIQKPTAIYMISGFMNSVRIIYTDGRKHTDPDIVISSFNGESIGHWEGDTLVVDTTAFVGDHHWIDSGVPASDQLHVIERMKLIDNGANLQIEYAMTDPKSWEGEWKWTKRWRRVDDQEITEAVCLPNLNEHMLSTSGSQNVR
ncbi:MAG: hypothetical protein ABI811_21330 [Acidobacteriota bacterium]